MDFSSLNPLTTNALHLAARRNDFDRVEKLLKEMNPNCVDNRGWTCLHEAAAKDSYQSLLIILQHKDIRFDTVTHEGHTALFIACQYMSSIQTIQAVLEKAPALLNYGTTENVTPLHIASALGRIEVVQLLIECGAKTDVQDFDGDTPLHDATLSAQHDVINLLLHMGATPDVKNEMDYTPLHLACFKGCHNIVKTIFPFINDINSVTVDGNTPLILATQICNNDIIKFLLINGADPHIENKYGDVALMVALNMGYSSSFKILLSVTSYSNIPQNIISYACKPHLFKMEILESLLTHDFGPEFFDFVEEFHVVLEQIGGFKPNYKTNATINSYLNICEYIYNESPDKFKEFFYLFLMRGLSVNAMEANECPPLVYIHYCMHTSCFKDVFDILREHGCNVDYCSKGPHVKKVRYISDALLASLTEDPETLLMMLPYSLYCDPEYILEFALNNGISGRIQQHVQSELLSMIGTNDTSLPIESLRYTVLPLKHLSRQIIRASIRYMSDSCITTDQYIDILNQIQLPPILKNYLRYI